MNETTDQKLAALLAEINAMLDMIHDQALRNFRRLARSTGQFTRVDRAAK